MTGRRGCFVCQNPVGHRAVSLSPSHCGPGAWMNQPRPSSRIMLRSSMARRASRKRLACSVTAISA